MVSLKVNFQKKDLWLFSAIVVFLVGVGFVIAFGGNNPAVMGHDAGELTGVCKTDGTGCPTTSQTPYYRVKYNPNTLNIYTIDGFSTAPYIYNLPSFGFISGDDHDVPDGSYLFEMKVNVVNPVTKTLKLIFTDNNIQFFLDGTKVAPPTGQTWNNVNYRTDATKKADFVLSSGQHTIQIIFNAEGGPDYLSVIGDIVDNTDVKFVGF
ncbi:MAG: hypothetical protein AABW67_04130 [Nanoarchaeota archaeon]